MAIRFIDTGFYKSPYVRGLKGALKGLYSFIICDCSPAGIWIKDLKIASEYIGFSISEKDFNDEFVKTGKALSLENGKYFFPDFIEHQYPRGLQNTNPAHKNIISELQRYFLLDTENQLIKRGFQGASKGLPSSISNSNGNSIGNSEGNNKLIDEINIENNKEAEFEWKEPEGDKKPPVADFELFWDEYHKITKLPRTDKDAAVKYWDKLKDKDKNMAVNKIQSYFDSLNDKKYCKKARTYLRDKNFNDEFEKHKILNDYDFTDDDFKKG